MDNFCGMRTSTRVAALAAAAAALFATASPASAALTPDALLKPSIACGAAVITLYDFTITAEPDKKVYKPGDVAKVKVTVTRPGREDPLGNGIPLNSPHHEPAEDVQVAVGLFIKRTYMYGNGITDSNGEEIVKIRIDRRAPEGSVDAEAAARNVVNQQCPDIYEVGYASYRNFAKISR